MLRSARTFLFRLSWRRKWWFLLMYPLSGVLRAAVLLLPFRWLSPLLGRQLIPSSHTITASQDQRVLAWQIGRSTELLDRFTPWQTKCLIQSLLCSLWCRWYRLECMTYLGVTKGKDGRMKAHSWTQVGDAIVTGREGHKQFAVVSAFCWTPRKHLKQNSQ